MLTFDYKLTNELRAPTGELPSGIQTQALAEALTQIRRKYLSAQRMLLQPVAPLKTPPLAGLSPAWQARLKSEMKFLDAVIPQINKIANGYVRARGNAAYQGVLNMDWDQWCGHVLQNYNLALDDFEKEAGRALGNAVASGAPPSFVKLATLARMPLPEIAPVVLASELSALEMPSKLMIGAVVGAGLLALWYMRGSLGDLIPGGYADGVSPSQVDPEQLRMGIEVEMEHTNDPRIAREIAMDHLVGEDPRYYTKLLRAGL